MADLYLYLYVLVVCIFLQFDWIFISTYSYVRFYPFTWYSSHAAAVRDKKKTTLGLEPLPSQGASPRPCMVER